MSSANWIVVSRESCLTSTVENIKEVHVISEIAGKLHEFVEARLHCIKSQDEAEADKKLIEVIANLETADSILRLALDAVNNKLTLAKRILYLAEGRLHLEKAIKDYETLYADNPLKEKVLLLESKTQKEEEEKYLVKDLLLVEWRMQVVEDLSKRLKEELSVEFSKITIRSVYMSLGEVFDYEESLEKLIWKAVKLLLKEKQENSTTNDLVSVLLEIVKGESLLMNVQKEFSSYEMIESINTRLLELKSLMFKRINLDGDEERELSTGDLVETFFFVQSLKKLITEASNLIKNIKNEDIGTLSILLTEIVSKKDKLKNLKKQYPSYDLVGDISKMLLELWGLVNKLKGGK